MIQSYNSRLLDNAVEHMAKLPGIGQKTALRLALHLLRQEEDVAVGLGEAISEMRRNVRYCRKCHNICDSDLCSICSSPKRDTAKICVVESVKDVLTLEATHEFNGLYHVLGGVISPLDGISPSDLQIESLIARVREDDVEEVILALNPTIEGDTTNFYIFRKLSDSGVKISILARGISIGNELEYTDELTLGRSIINRVPFSDTFTAQF
ncbi:MAG: recombination mediator RecR [Muribaculaceae bacterium]|nr:recombination mediator RecR [Muribaculaceae bacterium]